HLPSETMPTDLLSCHSDLDRQSCPPRAETRSRNLPASGTSAHLKNDAPTRKAGESPHPSLLSRETPPDSHWATTPVPVSPMSFHKLVQTTVLKNGCRSFPAFFAAVRPHSIISLLQTKGESYTIMSNTA